MDRIIVLHFGDGLSEGIAVVRRTEKSVDNIFAPHVNF